MENICCTIVTPSHMGKAVVMLNSLKRYNNTFRLIILTTEQVLFDFQHIEIIELNRLVNIDPVAEQITVKYSTQNDEMRWSLKPVLIRYLLNQFDNANVIYCDSDMYFTENPEYLLNSLDLGGIVLTPHWRPLHPSISLNNFRLNFQDGLFNAGCIAANKNAIEALDWWALVCLSCCEANREKGLWHDQRYLDLMIIYFPATVVCRHRGYNVADWNNHHRKDLFDTNCIENVVLIHFTINTVKKIIAGADPLLESYYSKYVDELEVTHRNLLKLAKKTA